MLSQVNKNNIYFSWMWTHVQNQKALLEDITFQTRLWLFRVHVVNFKQNFGFFFFSLFLLLSTVARYLETHCSVDFRLGYSVKMSIQNTYSYLDQRYLWPYLISIRWPHKQTVCLPQSGQQDSVCLLQSDQQGWGSVCLFQLGQQSWGKVCLNQLGQQSW